MQRQTLFNVSLFHYAKFNLQLLLSSQVLVIGSNTDIPAVSQKYALFDDSIAGFPVVLQRQVLFILLIRENAFSTLLRIAVLLRANNLKYDVPLTTRPRCYQTVTSIDLLKKGTGTVVKP